MRKILVEQLHDGIIYALPRPEYVEHATSLVHATVVNPRGCTLYVAINDNGPVWSRGMTFEKPPCRVMLRITVGAEAVD